MLWVLSNENFARPPREVSGNFAAIEAKLKLLAKDPQIYRQRVRAHAVGRLKLSPAPSYLPCEQRGCDGHAADNRRRLLAAPRK